MRRLLFILILACLPLQSIWAAAASYCGHETAPAAAHFGHHQHLVHDGHAAAASGGCAHGHDGTSVRTGGVDMDCHVCHGVGSALHAEPAATALRLGAMRPAPFVLPLLRAPAPARPERPNWPRFA